MATAILDLLPQVFASAPTAPNQIVTRYMRDAAREFCRRTLAWKADVLALTVTADTANVTVTPPTDGVLIDINSAVLDNNTPLVKKTRAQLDKAFPKWRTEAGTPTHITLSETQNDILLVKIPATTYTSLLDVSGVFVPTLTATTLDDNLVDRYGEDIVNGALYRLLRLPGKPWSDPNQALFYGTLFEDAINDAKTEVADGNMVGVARKVTYGGL
jgi:hypothetical protein